MTIGLLDLVYNFSKLKSLKISNFYEHKIRIQKGGDPLEYFIKDLLADTIDIDDQIQKEEKYQQVFSYFGASNNPPDVIIRGGDSIEIKKISSLTSTISLNSSYPKSHLRIEDKLITTECRECEDWTIKDMIYCIGSVDSKTTLKSLWCVMGDCYCSHYTTYEKVKNTITSGIKSIPNIELAPTNELGRLNRIDPLGITYLRVRGMWGIEHPSSKSVFGYRIPNSKDNILNVVMTNRKFYSFDEDIITKITNSPIIHIDDLQIRNPNNPVQLLDGKYIYIQRKDIR